MGMIPFRWLTLQRNLGTAATRQRTMNIAVRHFSDCTPRRTFPTIKVRLNLSPNEVSKHERSIICYAAAVIDHPKQ